MKKNNNNWYKLDNAGKMFQVTHKPYCDSIYRIAVNLKKEVKPKVLECAVNDLRKRFPTFFVKVKNGFFWPYYENNISNVAVKEESPFVNQYINPQTNNNFMFAVYYYKNRISLECLHAISDGYGSLEFLKSLVFHYLELLGEKVESEGLIMLANDTPTESEFEDSYLKYYEPKFKLKKAKMPRAYIPLGKKLDKTIGYGLIYGKMDSGELLKVAKKYNASITQYLTALYVYSLYKTHNNRNKKKLCIHPCVPVNLRGIFPSRTLRNFSLVFYCAYSPKQKWTFDSILEKTKEYFAIGVTKDYLQAFLNSNIKIEKNPLLKIVPFPIKKIAIKIGKKLAGDLTNTRSISNLGIVKMPESMAEHIIDFECSNTDAVSIMTANNRATISFTRTIVDTEVEQFFFSTLSKEGIKIEIQSNLKEEIN